MTSESICEFYLRDFCSEDFYDLEQFNVTFPSGSIKKANRSFIPPVNDKRKLKVLHLTDPLYEFARQKNFSLEKELLSDDNLSTLELAFKHISHTHKVDFSLAFCAF